MPNLLPPRGPRPPRSAESYPKPEVATQLEQLLIAKFTGEADGHLAHCTPYSTCIHRTAILLGFWFHQGRPFGAQTNDLGCAAHYFDEIYNVGQQALAVIRMALMNPQWALCLARLLPDVHKTQGAAFMDGYWPQWLPIDIPEA